MTLLNLKKFFMLAFLETQLNDTSSSQIIACQKIKIILIFPGFTQKPGTDKQLMGNLVMQRSLIGQSFEDGLAGRV
jgi:malate/lactate dehydrogenase